MAAGRYTRKDAETAFIALCAALGKRVAADWRDRGAWTLDYAACYGGYVVAELTENGGQGHPLGHTRRSAKDFYLTAWYAVDAIRIKDRDAEARVSAALTAAAVGA